MNTAEIHRTMIEVLENQAPHLRAVYKGVFPANHVPRRQLKTPYAMILNTQPSASKGLHWVAVYRAQEQACVEYFDSFARKPIPAIISLFEPSLSVHAREICYSKKQIQSNYSSLCGEYCIVYLCCRLFGMSFEEFLSVFEDLTKSKWYTNDLFVLTLCFLLTGQSRSPREIYD